MSELSLLPSEPLLRQYTEVITDLYRNITIEGNQASHFHVVVRDSESRMAWRHRLLETSAEACFNRALRRNGTP
ncbi:TPA: DUF905 family protein [Escherichia coli]|nr:DUF905 family protein [Escherichia coli]